MCLVGLNSSGPYGDERNNQISLNAPEGVRSPQGELKTNKKQNSKKIALTTPCLSPGKGLEPPSVRQTRDFSLKGSTKPSTLCTHKTQTSQGVFGRKRNKIQLSKARGGGNPRLQKLLLCKVPDVRRPIFKSWGWGEPNYVHSNFSSF